MKKNVLIGFEESQASCIAFRKLGHNAFSCDLKKCSGGKPEWHLQMDIFQAIRKSRIAIPHTCGLEPMSIKTKLFYAIEDPESPESDEPTIHHKWGKWKKEPIPKILRGAVTGLAVRKCSVCGANQHRTYYRGQKYPSLDIERNGRSDVDCNPELKPQSKT